MADACENLGPLPKKRRSDPFDDIFRKVVDKNEDGRVRRQLEAAVVCLELGLNTLLVRELKVLDANANRAVPFSKASIGMDKYQTSYALGTIFRQGHAVLKKYLESDVSKKEILVPKDAQCRKALEILLKFIESHQEADFLSFDGKEEWQWTLELAQRVFSKLAVNSRYRYDIALNYDGKLGRPCLIHDILDGEKGDTSFGCEKGWHGNIDILMADVPICPVTGEQDLPLPSSSVRLSSDSDSCIGVEAKRNKFNDSDYSQIVSETITFAFLKNKGKSDKDITLVPSLAINKTGVQGYFYDSIKDVLLQTGFVELIPPKSCACRMNVNGIVLIWLTLNHQLFCTGTLPEMKKSGFHKLVDLQMYREEVQAPCRIIQDPEKLCISDQSWASVTTDSVRVSDVSPPEIVPVINLLEEEN